MRCKKCKEENKELTICEDCYSKLYGDYLAKLMQGDADFQVLETIRNIKWELKEEINLIHRNLNEINNALKDFKIRGLRLKSTQKREE